MTEQRSVRNDYTIKTATRYKGGGGWTIETTDGTGFGVSEDRVDDEYWDKFKPQKGDAITLYTRQGSSTVGLDWKGERVFLYTDEEWEAERAFQSQRYERQKAERFAREEGKLNADYDALPEVFKDRINRFRKNNPGFRRDYESYEMFTCKEAVQLADRARDAVATGKYAKDVDEFWASERKREEAGYGEPLVEPDLPELRWLLWATSLNSKAYDYDYKRCLKVTGMSDGHSGNTAGAATYLARLYIESPEYVAKVHGALSPLVGSEAYGDVER